MSDTRLFAYLLYQLAASAQARIPRFLIVVRGRVYATIEGYRNSCAEKTEPYKAALCLRQCQTRTSVADGHA